MQEVSYLHIESSEKLQPDDSSQLDHICLDCSNSLKSWSLSSSNCADSFSTSFLGTRLPSEDRMAVPLDFSTRTPLKLRQTSHLGHIEASLGHAPSHQNNQTFERTRYCSWTSEWRPRWAVEDLVLQDYSRFVVYARTALPHSLEDSLVFAPL